MADDDGVPATDDRSPALVTEMTDHVLDLAAAWPGSGPTG